MTPEGLTWGRITVVSPLTTKAQGDQTAVATERLGDGWTGAAVNDEVMLANVTGRRVAWRKT